ncbi:MAG TPA: YihY/virulence factor BrkB family protein [Dokdonella sp.]
MATAGQQRTTASERAARGGRPERPKRGTNRSAWSGASLLAVAKRAFASFSEHDVLTLAASLAFYTLLSFAPLMVLGVWAGASLGHSGQAAMLSQIGALAGDDARQAAQAVIDSANKRPSAGSIAGLVGIVTSLIGATTVFAQLQSSLNWIWGIRAVPSNAIWGWLRRRVLSVGVIAAITFVLLVSLVVSSALGLLLTHSGPIWDVANQVITVLVFAVLFAALFRYLPDARLDWRTAGWGGLATAVLFGIGKWLIGLYLSRGDVGGAYGAAGSFVVLLVWVYYSSTIFFIGAELIRAWLEERGREIQPAAHAERRAEDAG